MKGVILSLCPDVTLVDITHDIPPHDVVAGAMELVASYKFFPVGTIFLVVVAPDNGVLTLVFKEAHPKRVVELTERRYARPTVSRTFEGRDRFAPAAAWLAKGIELAGLGRPLAAWQSLTVPEPIVSETTVTGEVLRVDRFGNLVTNVDRRTFDRFAGAGGLEITAGPHAVTKVVATYSEAEPGTVCALFGSTEHLEIAVNGASAADQLQLARGAPVTISRS
jgi:S-adenosylmethionine hydrolase